MNQPGWPQSSQPADVVGGGSGGSGGGGGTVPNTTPTTNTGQTPAPTTPNTGAANPGTFGQSMYPWLMPWGGNYTAPMSGYEQGALGGYNNFVQGGMGLNPAGGYLNNVLSGQYLNMNTNPYLQQIQQGEQGMKNYNDQQALNKIGNSMALGGNAMSGARLGATSDYMRNSNNAFESMMGQLMNQNYQGERGLMSQAPGQLANLANTAGSGYAQLFGMGALPRQLQQNDLTSQYQDFLRQGQGMQSAYQTPDQQIMSMLYGGGYKGQYQPIYGSSTLDQIAGNLGSSGIDYASLFNSLLGSNTGADGQVIGYDSAAPVGGPSNYYDKNWYLNALTNAEAQQQQSIANAQKGPNTTIPAILTLLTSLLGGKKSGGVGGRTGGINGGSGSGGGGKQSLIDAIMNRNNPYQPGSALYNEWRQQFHDSGAPMNPAQPDIQVPQISPIGYTPGDPLSGGGTNSFADIYNNMQSLPPDVYNASNGPNISPMDPTMLQSLGGGGGSSADTWGYGSFGDTSGGGGGDPYAG
jgi:hypothetical protein